MWTRQPGRWKNCNAPAAQIREHWSDVVILVRGDSAYSREEIMSWCEAQPNVEYILAYAGNERLGSEIAQPT